VSCCLYLGDAAALHAQWTTAGVDGRHGPHTDADYRPGEAHHIDPDGNLVRYGSPLPQPDPGSEA
jgi:hypothetical protein